MGGKGVRWQRSMFTLACRWQENSLLFEGTKCDAEIVLHFNLIRFFSPSLSLPLPLFRSLSLSRSLSVSLSLNASPSAGKGAFALFVNLVEGAEGKLKNEYENKNEYECDEDCF